MFKRLTSNLHFINLLLDTDIKKIQKKVLIETTTTEQLKTILEIVGNVLYGNIPISDVSKRKLRKHKTLLQTLWHDRSTLSKKRKYVLRHYSAINNVVQSARTFIIKQLKR